MDAIAAAANVAFARRLDPASPAPVALALSGGGDSLALLLLAADWCDATGRPLLALTVDHRLHPDSGAWTEAAGRAAMRVGAAWRALSWDGPKPSAGLPAAARAARHRLLADAARAAGAKVLLTGHTLDDRLEGELMRAGAAPGLGRLREWSPSPAWPEGRGLFLLRPLLDQRRADLRAWLAARGQDWLDDPANADVRFARVRARATLSALGDAVVASESPRADPTAGWLDLTSDGRILAPRQGLGGALFAAALLCTAGTARPPRGEALSRLQDRLRQEGAVQATLAGARIVAEEATIQVGRDAGERFRGGLTPVLLTAGTASVWDARFELVADEPGWTAMALGGRMAALPSEDRRRLRTIPAWARGALPALVHADERVRLPRPFGEGPGQAASLAGPRLVAACGLIARETEIAAARDGAEGVLTLCSGPGA